MISESDVIEEKIEALSRTEMRVLALLCDGHVNKVIADRLFISSHTAKFHINNIMRKLKAQTRTEAAVKAIRKGIIQ